MMGELYRLSFPNGKAYIGITSKTAQERFAVHFYQRRQKRHPLYQAINKYGRNSVVIETLAVAPVEDLCRLECEAIALHSTKWPNGYNLTDGGEGTTGLTELSLLKMAATHRGNKYRVGMKHSDETKALMSANRKGKKKNLTPEQREVRRLGLMGNKRSLGVVHSPELVARRAAGVMRGDGAKANSSGVKGVCWCKQTNKWRAHITPKGKMRDLGRFDALADAIDARKRAEAIVLSGGGV